MSLFEQTRFYQETCSKVRNDGKHTVYELSFPDGGGVMIRVAVFPGVDLYVNHFRARTCEENNETVDLLLLNFCAAGRFETLLTPTDAILLGPGDFSAHRDDLRKGTRCEFPLGYYDGLNIQIDTATAATWCRENFPSLDIDFDRVQSHLLGDHWYYVQHAGLRCEHVLMELYEEAEHASIPTLQVKMAELFLLLEELPLREDASSYFPKTQVELAHSVRDRLIGSSSGTADLEQIARDHNVSVSQLRRVFRSVYGVPVYQYLKEYRLERAAQALSDSTRTITAIALEAGYTNSGKFSAAFRERYGMTPTEFRQQSQRKRQNGSS